MVRVIAAYMYVLLITASTFTTEAKKKMVCTTTILYDLALNIAGDSAQVQCLLPFGSDPHIYEPTPADGAKLAQADLIIKNGLYLEGWLEKVIQASASNIPLCIASDGIKPVQATLHTHSPDPHIWMDVTLAMTMAENIYKSMAQLEPSKANYFKKNLELYLQKLDSLHAYIKSEIQKIPPEKRVLITTHDAFRYYGLQYGLTVESALGNTTDAEVQIGDLNRLINLIKSSNVPAIFVESTINPKLLTQIATDQGIIIGGNLFSDSIGDENSPANSYINMLMYNTHTIVNALSAGNALHTSNEKAQLLLLLLCAFLLFLWGFVWLYLRLNHPSTTLQNWKNYTIEVKNLTVSYERKTVISNINFTIESGKIYGLLGPNGAGKSTLFKSILGLIKPDTGMVLINGRKVNEVKKYIAYIPQKEEIDWRFPATVFDIVLAGRLPHKGKFEHYNKKDKIKAIKAIYYMGLQNFKNRQIGDLSGGQQQKAFIARAICQDAEVLFFDEPFVGVDILSEEKIIQIIKKLALDGKTILMIHHDLSKVKEYFDQVIMINQSLVAIGPAATTFTQENMAKTYRGRLAMLQETDTYLFNT